MNLQALRDLFECHGCVHLYAKVLAENDNSKNQVYFGPGFEALSLFPSDEVRPDSTLRASIFKASVPFFWLAQDGGLARAKGAQLILYPQYPEVRFSGFLKGCRGAPSELMRSRLAGRVLFLGVTSARTVIGHVVSAKSSIANEFRSLALVPEYGVFAKLPLLKTQGLDARVALLGQLRRIHEMKWIDSKQLSADGTLKPCNAPQCGGFTLEAELGIPKNSKAEPDFLGWEIKQHQVTRFDRFEVGTITLMTPEPSGGLYCDEGPEAFIRRYGYSDRRNRPNRLNFGGIHRVGQCHSTTGLELVLDGYNNVARKITNSSGAITLVDRCGKIAASWHFSKLIEHWTRKHAKAAYVPSKCELVPRRRYCYGDIARLAVGTDFLRFLDALAKGKVYYDPGLKLEEVSSTHAKVKRRNQFRIASRNIKALYEAVDVVSLMEI